MSRVFVVHVNRTSPVSVGENLEALRKVDESYCNYAFTDEDEADDFVEVLTGYDPKYMGITYGMWSERRDEDGTVWSIKYDEPYELDANEFHMRKKEVLDF